MTYLRWFLLIVAIAISAVACTPGRGFVNVGPDPRAGGLVGEVMSSLQRGESFKSPHEPRFVKHEKRGDCNHWEYASVPRGLPYHVIFCERDGKYDTWRMGYRYDKFWGDAGLPPGSFNPNPEIIGGYIYDVIVKLQREENDLPAHY